MDKAEKQKEICDKYEANYLACPDNFKIGISLGVKDGNYPIHGLRRPVEGDTTGWYIWSGGYSSDPDFFQPIHVKHIKDWNPLIEQFLGLEPG